MVFVSTSPAVKAITVRGKPTPNELAARIMTGPWTIQIPPEEGMKIFYRSVGEMLNEGGAVELFQELSIAEEHHQAALSDLHFRFSGKRVDPDFLRSAAPDLQAERYIEGGLRLEEAILWAEGKQMADILDMSITLEANAYDRYLFMKQEIKDARAKEVFNVLSNEEKHHLERLSELFDRLI